jgi:protein-S-isoprenylcysteine O-methyltransferase Ste14
VFRVRTSIGYSHDVTPERWLFAVLLLACFCSFAWGTIRVFVLPTGLTRGMQFIKLANTLIGGLDLIVILGSRAPLPGFSQNCLAVTLYFLGGGLFLWTAHTIKDRPFSAIYSTDIPVHLVVRGPYRFVRHPFYLSYLAVWSAGVFATGNAWLALPVAAMLWVYWNAAKSEERKFELSGLAQDYRAYRESTGMLFPRFFISASIFQKSSRG